MAKDLRFEFGLFCLVCQRLSGMNTRPNVGGGKQEEKQKKKNTEKKLIRFDLLSESTLSAPKLMPSSHKYLSFSLSCSLDYVPFPAPALTLPPAPPSPVHPPPAHPPHPPVPPSPLQSIPTRSFFSIYLWWKPPKYKGSEHNGKMGRCFNEDVPLPYPHSLNEDVWYYSRARL